MRRLFLGALLLAGAPLRAQTATPWRASYFPYLIGNSTTGLLGVLHYQYGRQADYDARVPFDGIVSAEAGASWQGSWLATLRFRAPLLVEGWRFSANAGAIRESTYGYWGTGADGSSEFPRPGPGYGDSLFQVHRTRILVSAEATRRLYRGVQLTAAAGFTHYRYSSPAAASLFNVEYGGAPLTGSDATGRMSLVGDFRDNEFLPTKGALLEAGIYGGTGSFESRSYPPVVCCGQTGPIVSTTDGGYAGAYAHLRGYVTPRSGTVLAGRFAFRALGAGAPLVARQTLPGWEDDFDVLGGPESHRSFPAGRFTGRGLVLTSLEVRHTLLDVGDYGAITVLAFLDAGRAFGTEGSSLSLTGWKVGGGGGLALRVLRSSLLTFNFAGGPDGFRFSMGKGWAF